MRLEHIAFNVKDVKALAAWYVANLGMTIVREIQDPPHMTFLADSAGKSLIEVYSDPAGEYLDYGAYHPVTFHLAFAVDDMDATTSRLLAAGARQDGDINVTPLGDRLAFLRDPWGHAIQLVQRSAPMMD